MNRQVFDSNGLLVRQHVKLVGTFAIPSTNNNVLFRFGQFHLRVVEQTDIYTTTLLVVPNTTTTFAQGTIRSPHEKKGSVAKRTALEFGI